MGLIRAADANAIARDALVLDLGDLKRQGAHIIDDAKRKAEAILSEARAEHDRLVGEASQKGYEEGLTRGTAEGRATGAAEGRAEAIETTMSELGDLRGAWTSALDVFEAQRRRLASESIVDVVRLASAVASRVTRKVVELDPETVSRQLESVLAMVLRPTSLLVAVHPEDRTLAEDAMGALVGRLAPDAECELVDDPDLSRGSVVVRHRGIAGAGGEIDASIETQLDRIAEALTTGVGAAGSEPGPEAREAEGGDA